MQHKADSSLTGKDLRGQDLRYSDLTDKVLFETDLRGADLYGAKISLHCQTFDGVKLDNSQVAYLLMMLSKADIDPQYRDGIHKLTRAVAGERAYQVLLRLMSLI